MRIVFALIAFITFLVVAAMVNSIYNPTPVPAVSPAVAAERHRKDEEERKAEVVRRAYQECRETKFSDMAILRCVRDKIS